MTTLALDQGGHLTIGGAPLGSGGEAEVFAAGPHVVVKRFHSAEYGYRRLAVARCWIDLGAGPLRHPALAPLVLPIATIADADGAPGIVLPRIPEHAVDAMNIVLPGAFTSLSASKRGTLRARVIIAARMNAAVHAVHTLAAGVALPDCGLRNMAVDMATMQVWLFDTDSAWMPGLSCDVITSPQFAAPELATGTTPTAVTDRHTMAINTFMLLLGRHPFDGGRTDLPRDPVAADEMAFVRHPVWTDDRNDARNPRPEHGIAADTLGQIVFNLMNDAFGSRSHPGRRPDGATWAHQLTWLTDRLVPCGTAGCWWGAVPWQQGSEHLECPACGARPRGPRTGVLLQFLGDDNTPCQGEVAVAVGQRLNLYPRHLFDRPATLHGSPVGIIRKRVFGNRYVADVDGYETVELRPGHIVRIGERRAQVIAIASRLTPPRR